MQNCVVVIQIGVSYRKVAWLNQEEITVDQDVGPNV